MSKTKTAAFSRGSKKNVPLEVIIELVQPIEIGGAKVDQITMRYPTVKDRLDADDYDGSPADRELFLMARLCGLAPDDFHAMHLADYSDLQEALGKFMGGQQKASE